MWCAETSFSLVSTLAWVSPATARRSCQVLITRAAELIRWQASVSTDHLICCQSSRRKKWLKIEERSLISQCLEKHDTFGMRSFSSSGSLIYYNKEEKISRFEFIMTQSKWLGFTIIPPSPTRRLFIKVSRTFSQYIITSSIDYLNTFLVDQVFYPSIQ